MKSNLFMDCLWYEDLTPEKAAIALNLTPIEFYDKVFGVADFTLKEIAKLTELLGLTTEEVDMIFF